MKSLMRVSGILASTSLGLLIYNFISRECHPGIDTGGCEICDGGIPIQVCDYMIEPIILVIATILLSLLFLGLLIVGKNKNT